MRGRLGAGPEDSLSQGAGRGPTGGAGVPGLSLSAVGIFSEVEDRDAESRGSFARVGHRVRFAEKVCIAVYNHSTGLTVITGLSFSPVQSRSWSSLGPRLLLQVHPLRWVVLAVSGILYSCSDEFLAVAVHSLATGRVDGARCSESALSWASRGFGGLLEIGRFPWIARRFATSELSAQQLAL